MSVFADGYSRYLSYNFNYIDRLKLFRKYFRSSVKIMADPNFMARSLIDRLDQFPKYPYFYNPLIRTDSLNLVKIYNSTLDNTSDLVESMLDSDELMRKKVFDTIPNTVEDFLEEICFQFSYISTASEIYNYELIVRSFVSDSQFRNFFSDLYVPYFYSSDQIEGDTAGLENSSATYQYLLYSCLYNMFSISHNIGTRGLLYLTHINDFGPLFDRVDKTIMLIDFDVFVNNYVDQMSADLAINVGKAIYSFQKISPIMLQNLSTVIRDSLLHVTSGLSASFYLFFYSLDTYPPAESIITNFLDNLNSLMSADVVSKIYNDATIVDTVEMSSQTNNENLLSSGFMEKIAESQLKNYLFLCFLYKYWPVKFLNILQLTIREYVENYIKTTNDDSLTLDEYKNLISTFCESKINYTNLNQFLNLFLLPTPTLVTYGAGISAKFTFTPTTDRKSVV